MQSQESGTEGKKQRNYYYEKGGEWLNLSLGLARNPLKKDQDDNYSEISSKMVSCNFCARKFCSTQALGGHQNAHRKERHHNKATPYASFGLRPQSNKRAIRRQYSWPGSFWVEQKSSDSEVLDLNLKL